MSWKSVKKCLKITLKKCNFSHFLLLFKGKVLPLRLVTQRTS